MAKYCNVCRQTYAVEYASCPFCEVPAPLDRSRRHQPLPANDPTPLPLGAGRIEPRAESSEHRDNRTAAAVGPRSSAKALLGQSSPPPHAESAADDGNIDLGSPALDGKRGSETGPPSGASFISWTSLINDRKDFDDDQPAGPSARVLLGNGEDAKSATKLLTSGPPRSSIWFYVAAVAIGALLAVVVKLLR